MTALLDVNVFVALVWPAHEQHGAAHQWLRARPRARWASCPLTQLGLLRLVSNPAFSPDALILADAVTLLGRNTAHPQHEFWPDALPAARAVKALAGGMTGHQQVTDAYLLALAVRRKGCVATFDAGLSALAAAAGLGAHVDLVPAR